MREHIQAPAPFIGFGHCTTRSDLGMFFLILYTFTKHCRVWAFNHTLRLRYVSELLYIIGFYSLSVIEDLSTSSCYSLLKRQSSSIIAPQISISFLPVQTHKSHPHYTGFKFVAFMRQFLKTQLRTCVYFCIAYTYNTQKLFQISIAVMF